MGTSVFLTKANNTHFIPVNDLIKQSPINIGPMQLTIDQPMNELTFSLKDPDNKLNCNLKFSANSVAHQEPRSLMMEANDHEYN